MSRNDRIDENALWASLERLQADLERTLKSISGNRQLSAFGPLAPVLRDMHWSAAFLGLTRLADVAATGAAYVTQLQESRFRWSVDHANMVASLLRRTRSFVQARPGEPSSGVYLDTHQAVIQGPELKRPVPSDDIIRDFRKRQIDPNIVSACRQISVGKDPSFSHSITVPPFAKKRHRKERYLTLVYLDLEEQELGLSAFSEALESAFGKREILLHGPMGIPWKKYKDEQSRRPYYILLDSDLEARDWLKAAGIRGKPVRVLKSPESEGDSEARVIIREVPSAPVYYPAPVPYSSGTADQRTGESSGFGMESIPLVKVEEVKRPVRRVRGGRDPELKIKLSTKLILIVSSIIVISLATTTLMGLYFFRRSLSIQSEDSNISMSAVVAKQAENELVKIINSANLLFQVGSAAGADSTLVDDFFANESQLIYVGIPGSPLQYASRDWFRNNRIFEEKVVLAGILEARRDDLEKARSGETVIVNASPLIPNLESPVIAIAVPFLLGAQQEALVILADIGNTLIESVRLQQGNSTIIVNPAGELLAVAETSRLFGGEDISGTAAFEKIYTDGLDFGQIEYSEVRDGVARDYIGFYRLIRNFNLGVITTTLKADVFRDVQKILLLNLYFGLTILSLSILGVFFFARSISIPVNELWLATRKIKAKQWQGAILRPRTRDEVGVLTRNFNAMVPALRATDDLLENTKVFVNEDVATMIFENRLPRTATTKDVTVFFSDVRDFTSMSEGMGDPQVVLKNLSEYFDSMVPCVRNTGGTVDKFIGDAVMAVWGSMGEPLENNAESAINGALMMRKAIIEFNRTRMKGDRMRPPFQIGCGIHSGPATVGIMGSSHKQEWAHMGPTVNLASRIEGVNKELGTDILISPETAARVSGIFQLQPMVKIHPKGVEKPIQIYTVLGRLDDRNRPGSLDELRKRLGREAYNSIGTESHGAKYKIITD